MNLFIVTTPYHLLVSCSICNPEDYLLVEKADFINSAFGNEYMSAFFPQRTIVLPSYSELFRHPLTARKVLKECIPNLDNKISCEIDNLFYFNDTEPIVQFLIYYFQGQTKHVLLEEGIGVYNDIHHRGKILKKCFGKIIFGDWYKCIQRIGLYPLTDIIVCKSPSLLNDDQKMKMIKEYDYAALNALISQKRMPIERRFWFVGQPLIEDGICEENEYFTCIKNCIAIAKSRNDRLVIKVHPREDINKYRKHSIWKEAEIFEDKDIPFELLINADDDTFIFSIFSSSLLHLSENKKMHIFFLYPVVRMENTVSWDLFERSGIEKIEDWEQLFSLFRG